MDSSEEEATRTPVHGSWAHEPRVDWPSAHETQEEHTSGWGTWLGQPEHGGEPSGHADDGGEPTDEEGEEGGNVYQHGATRLPSVPVTRE